jgi:hypothetical protein
MTLGHIRMEVEMVLDSGLLLWYIHNHEVEVMEAILSRAREVSSQPSLQIDSYGER